MFRLSKLLEKLEDKIDARFKSWLARNKAKLPMRVPAVIVGWYFMGCFSIRCGLESHRPFIKWMKKSKASGC